MRCCMNGGNADRGSKGVRCSCGLSRRVSSEDGAERGRAQTERGRAGREIPKSLITWIFEDDLIPRGKLTEKQNYSIISDYLGTPQRVYDESGKEVWEMALRSLRTCQGRAKGSVWQSRTADWRRKADPIPFSGSVRG